MENENRRAEDAERPKLPLTWEEKNEWLIDGSLVYRLGEDGVNCDEINVTMANGSRGSVRCNIAAMKVLTLLTSPAAPAVDAAQALPAELDKLKALAKAATDMYPSNAAWYDERDFDGIEPVAAQYIAAADPAAILRIAALVAQLEAENDHLRGALGDEVAAATLLTDISIANGGFNATYEGGAAQMLAEQFAEQFRQSGATNYLEIGVASKSDGLRLLVTLQRCDGKTPATLKAEAEALVAQQAARIERLQLDESAAQFVIETQKCELALQAARISAADRLLKAAKVYAFNYLQDERDEPELCGYGPKQHAEIVELWESIEAQEGK